MDTAERAQELANSFAEGMDALVWIRELRAAPPLSDEAEITDFGAKLSAMKTGLTAMAAMKESGEGWTSMRISDDLLLRLDTVLAGLAALPGGTRLPGSLFDQVDLAWVAIENAMA